jgi:hypothetical protein
MSRLSCIHIKNYFALMFFMIETGDRRQYMSFVKKSQVILIYHLANGTQSETTCL